jgi:hypothetical protein
MFAKKTRNSGWLAQSAARRLDFRHFSGGLAGAECSSAF